MWINDPLWALFNLCLLRIPFSWAPEKYLALARYKIPFSLRRPNTRIGYAPCTDVKSKVFVFGSFLGSTRWHKTGKSVSVGRTQRTVRRNIITGAGEIVTHEIYFCSEKKPFFIPLRSWNGPGVFVCVCVIFDIRDGGKKSK